MAKPLLLSLLLLPQRLLPHLRSMLAHVGTATCEMLSNQVSPVMPPPPTRALTKNWMSICHLGLLKSKMWLLGGVYVFKNHSASLAHKKKKDSRHAISDSCKNCQGLPRHPGVSSLVRTSLLQQWHHYHCTSEPSLARDYRGSPAAEKWVPRGPYLCCC